MHNILQDNAFKPFKLVSTTTETKAKSSEIDPEIQKYLNPKEYPSRCPKLYELPKIRKPCLQLGPIVSTFNSSIEKL